MKKLSRLTRMRIGRYIEKMLIQPLEDRADRAVQAMEEPCDYAEPPKMRASMGSAPMYRSAMPAAVPAPSSLEGLVLDLDESFTEMLLRLIDERGLTDAQCYKKAGVDRKLFSKIRSNPHYRPKKNTALSFALALELNLEQTADLLKKAGFALSHSSKADLIVEYCITHRIYDVMTVNEALYEFDQPLLS